MRHSVLTIVFVILAASTAFGQIEDCDFYKTNIDDIVRTPDAARRADLAADLVDIGQASGCFFTYVAGATTEGATINAFRDLVRQFESSRSDKQSGAGTGGAGSTSIVAQGPVSRALSVATEYGALTQSLSGSVVTVRGNLAGLPSALVRQNIFPYCMGTESNNGYCIKNSLVSVLRRVSFGISFDPSRNSESLTATGGGASPAASPAQKVSFTGNRREIVGASARVEIWNHRDINSQEFRDQWADKVGAALSDPATQVLRTSNDLAEQIRNTPGYEAWRTESRDRIIAANMNRERVVLELKVALESLLDLVRTVMPNLRQQVAAALAAHQNFFLAQDEFIDSLADNNVAAFEYINNRPLGQSPTSSFRLILDMPLGTKTKVVANSAFTIYDRVPAAAQTSVKKFRDAQAGLQLDHGLGRTSINSEATISLAGYYQYQHTPALLKVDPANPSPGVTFSGLPAGATDVFTKTGNIFLAQAKLTLSPRNTSAKIPFSVTYSNRTELIDKATWRAQVGVSYDFDSLFSGLANR